MHGLMLLRAEAFALWVLALGAGCAGRTAPQASGVEVVRQAPDLALAQSVLVEGAESLEIPVRRRSLALLVERSAPAERSAWASRGLWDPSRQVQRTVSQALLDHLPESKPLLHDFVRRDGLDSYTRCSTAAGLARSGDVETLPVVRAAMEAEFELWQQAPCALAAAQMNDPAGRALLSEVIIAGDLPLELRFVDDLGRSGLEGLGGELADALPRLEPEIHLALATAILRLGESRGEEVFRDALSDDDIELQLEAIDFLLTLPPEMAAGLLRRASGSAKTPARLALIQLGEDSPEQAVQSLLALDREVRAAAARAIGGWLKLNIDGGSRRMVRLCQEALLEALQDPEDMVQLQALRALAGAGRAQDAEAIAPLLEADALRVRVEAAGALLGLLRPLTAG